MMTTATETRTDTHVEKSFETSRNSQDSLHYSSQQSDTVSGATNLEVEKNDTRESIDENHALPIAKILSKTISKSSYRDPGPPPDGGVQAWTQALMCHIVVINTWGYINTFGVFQTYYVNKLHHPPSDISWMGSVQIFLLFFVGTFSGRATDYGLFRITFVTGSLFYLVGVFMTSLSTRYWQLFLAQGLCTGIGNGLMFCPCLALLSTYFTRHRAVAIAFAASGTSTGGTMYPLLVQHLLPKIGFSWTVRVLGFVMLTLQVVALAFLRTRLPPRKSGPIFEAAAFKELSYTLFAIGMFTNFWGLYFAFYYIGSFGRNILGITPEDSINNLLVVNGIGFLGRMLPAYIADRYCGPLNILIPVVFTTGLLLYCWAAVHSRGGLTAFAVFYGIFAAGIQGLFPATLSSLTSDMKKIGVRMGMVFSVVSSACLTGPPLAGALIQLRGGNYLGAQMFAGSALFCGSAILIASRIARVGTRLKVRV